MGLFGGSAQASQQLSSSINFTPVFQIGDENETQSRATQTPTQSLVPTQRDEMRFAASVGMGGSGGPATFAGAPEGTPTVEAPEYKTEGKAPGNNNMLLIAGIGSIAAFMLLSKKKKKK